MFFRSKAAPVQEQPEQQVQPVQPVQPVQQVQPVPSVMPDPPASAPQPTPVAVPVPREMHESAWDSPAQTANGQPASAQHSSNGVDPGSDERRPAAVPDAWS